MGGGRIVVVGCVKGKLGTPAPARELYVSPLWRARRAYAEATGAPWYVLSARHGLLDPDAVIEPYDRRMTDLRRDQRAALGAKAAAELDRRVGGLAGRAVEVHAGADYVRAIAEPIRARGGSLEMPLEGLSIGRQLAWYAKHRPNRRQAVTDD